MSIHLPMLNRREMLLRSSAGFGYLAFAGMAGTVRSDEVSSNPLRQKAPHFEPRAKRVIFLCMQGGPSHVDTFDYKPELKTGEGKSRRSGNSRLLPSPWAFKQSGKSGLWISETLPEISEMADELCLIRSMHCDQPIHPRAMTQMHTGTAQFVRPSLGAWTLYGLGTGNDSLPGYIALNPPPASTQNFGSAFLPAIYQGTQVGKPQLRGGQRFNGNGDSEEQLPDLSNSRLSSEQQRRQLKFIQSMNRKQLNAQKSSDETDTTGIEGVIESYELAFRMQDTLPEMMDLSKESRATLESYGIGSGETDSFGRQCLLARRFAEAGVRFIELTHGNWDHHTQLRTQLPAKCREIDKPIAGLLRDLKARGMLKDTLVIWGGEFGRTPDAQNGDGRDHNNKGYTTWMAGGGVKGGFSYGETDEVGYEAVVDKCHIHDWHATILHLLGLDHKRLTYRYAGRDFRLTDVHGNVVNSIVS
jgi:hypothetical protein